MIVELIQSNLVKILKMHSFKRKKQIWVRDLDSVVHLASIGKSRFGPEIFLDVGIVVKDIPFGGLTKIRLDWHVSERATLLSKDQSPFLKALEADSGLADGVRSRKLQNLVDIAEETFYRRFSNKEEVMHFVSSQSYGSIAVSIRIKNWVEGIPQPTPDEYLSEPEIISSR